MPTRILLAVITPVIGFGVLVAIPVICAVVPAVIQTVVPVVVRTVVQVVG